MHSLAECAARCNARVACRAFESNGHVCQTIAGSSSTPLIDSALQSHGWASCLRNQNDVKGLSNIYHNFGQTSTTIGRMSVINIVRIYTRMCAYMLVTVQTNKKQKLVLDIINCIQKLIGNSRCCGFFVITLHHEVASGRNYVVMNPKSIPDLLKPSRTPQQKHQKLDLSYNTKCFQTRKNTCLAWRIEKPR